MQQELGKTIDEQEVKEYLIEEFEAVFATNIVSESITA